MSDFLVISPSLTPHQPQSFSCFSCNWPGIFPLETFAFILAFAWDPLPPDSPVARPPSPPPRLGVNVTLSMRSTLTDRVSPSPSNFPSPSLSPHRVLLWGWNLIPSIMLYNFFFFLLFMVTSSAYGCSWGRSWIGAATARLHHRHSNSRSEQHLWQLWIINPLSEARDWTPILPDTILYP